MSWTEEREKVRSGWIVLLSPLLASLHADKVAFAILSTALARVMVFPQSHQTKFLRSQEIREPRFEGADRTIGPGAKYTGLSDIALLSFPQGGLLVARKDDPPRAIIDLLPD